MDELPQVTSPPARPVLVFDGDCGFCRYWAARWRHRAGDAIEFLPFQDPQVGERFPELSRERFAAAVQLIDIDGLVYGGAHAVFRTLARLGRRLPRWSYEHVPGFAAVTEGTYRFVADHRGFASKLTRTLWGPDPQPSTYAFSSWLFLRLLGVIYLIAFVSLSVQVRGLIGQNGILPASEFMTTVRDWAVREHVGIDRFRQLPTVFWLGTSDGVLQGTCIAGAVLAILLMAGIAPVVLLPLLWLAYLSLMTVGRVFLWYQWDSLLLETGALAIFVAPLVWRHTLRRPVEPPRIAVALLWWLLFRLIFESGVVKLASGDPTWRGLTALTFHYYTQPLPTPIAWYAHQLPGWFHKFSTAAVLAIELAVPWLIAAPRRVRHGGAAILAGLQVVILLTGNYTFFNLLAIALCVPLVDDGVMRRVMSKVGEYRSIGTPAVPARSATRSFVLAMVVLITVPVSALTLARQFHLNPPGWQIVQPISDAVGSFQSVNGYGLFAVMTTTRPEIIIEGSNDGAKWLPYEFKYKAGDVARRPPWVAPHQPRLDWQMWFAALGSDDYSWLERFSRRLLEGSPPVLQLLAHDPFEGKPPQFIRVVVYDYRFADPAAHRRGIWWTRTELGVDSPVMSRSTPPAR